MLIRLLHVWDTCVNLMGCWFVELVFCVRVDHLLYKHVDSYYFILAIWGMHGSSEIVGTVRFICEFSVFYITHLNWAFSPKRVYLKIWDVLSILVSPKRDIFRPGKEVFSPKRECLWNWDALWTNIAQARGILA